MGTRGPTKIFDMGSACCCASSSSSATSPSALRSDGSDDEGSYISNGGRFKDTSFHESQIAGVASDYDDAGDSRRHRRKSSKRRDSGTGGGGGASSSKGERDGM